MIIKIYNSKNNHFNEVKWERKNNSKKRDENRRASREFKYLFAKNINE